MQSQTPSLVLWGETGAGKSWLANQLAGVPDDDLDDTDSQFFRSEMSSGSCTNTCQVGDYWLCGSKDNGLAKIIDVPGLGDTRGNKYDAQTVQRVDLVLNISTAYQYTAILLVINGQTRIQEATMERIKIGRILFPNDSRVIPCFTRAGPSKVQRKAAQTFAAAAVVDFQTQGFNFAEPVFIEEGVSNLAAEIRKRLISGNSTVQSWDSMPRSSKDTVQKMIGHEWDKVPLPIVPVKAATGSVTSSYSSSSSTKKSGGCFASDTKVYKLQDEIPFLVSIQEIKPGDKVLSQHQNGQILPETIMFIDVHRGSTTFRKIKFSDGSFVRVTPNHGLLVFEENSLTSDPTIRNHLIWAGKAQRGMKCRAFKNGQVKQVEITEIFDEVHDLGIDIHGYHMNIIADDMVVSTLVEKTENIPEFAFTAGRAVHRWFGPEYCAKYIKKVEYFFDPKKQVFDTPPTFYTEHN